MKKTLVLYTKRNSYYFGKINSDTIDIDYVYKEGIDYTKGVLKFLRKFSLPLTKLFYGNWYKKLNEYSSIVVFDVCFDADKTLLYNISKKASKADKYFYSWNIVKNEVKYQKMRETVDKAGFKYFCYDHGNCEKYNMHFNTIMYDKNSVLPSVASEYDTLFLGFLKDRKDKLLSLYNTLKTAGTNAKFVITAMRNETINETLPFEYSTSYIAYYDYLDMLSKSRAILDISQKGQDGYSMRVMEAIFYDKKLITTNEAVRNSSFYDENNVLIIDLDKTTSEEIHAFFEKEFHPYPEQIRDYYSFEAWIDRFC